MPFTIVRNDITRMKVDAIVNAANAGLQAGGGVCGAIFQAAGPAELAAACNPLAAISAGQAVITPGFALPARYIIHTVGPVYRDGKHGEPELLRLCYVNSLKLALENGCASIAFPVISGGIYGYPKAEAISVARSAIEDFLRENDMEIYLVVFDKQSFEISKALMRAVESYIDERFVTEDRVRPMHTSACLLEMSRKAAVDEEAPGEEVLDEADLDEAAPDEAALLEKSVLKVDLHRTPSYVKEGLPRRLRTVPSSSLRALIDGLDAPFSDILIRLIDAKGRTEVEVYKRANIDRKLFSKIRTGKGYTPSKRTAVALAIALELTLEETEDLLERAGYAISHSNKFDVIVEYFIKKRRYDIFEINEVLFHYDQPLLGG